MVARPHTGPHCVTPLKVTIRGGRLLFFKLKFPWRFDDRALAASFDALGARRLQGGDRGTSYPTERVTFPPTDTNLF